MTNPYVSARCDSAYQSAFLDWLACACGGADARAARAVRDSGDDLITGVAFAATAGHVLDFDDTFADGVAHVSAGCAPAALVLASHLGRSLRAMLEAYADGYEAMAGVAQASHPALYDAGWHPTAVCAPIGAAVAASRLLGLSAAERDNALALALLRAGGTRGSFGTDGKAIQVGLAVAAGVQAALLTRAGALVDAQTLHGPFGFDGVFGARWPENAASAGDDSTTTAAIRRTWIKAYPSCLGTHAPTEAVAQAREDGVRLSDAQLTVSVHPTARQAAHLDSVTDGLSAKFSIPYCVAHTLVHGPPRIRDFLALDAASVAASAQVTVTIDRSLPPFGAVLSVDERELARIACPRGAPERPIAASELAEKLTDLAGGRLDGLLVDLEAPAARALSAAGLRDAARVGPS